MFPSEMEDGQPLLDVNIDANLFSDFIEEGNTAESFAEDDAFQGFSWADDLISSASNPYAEESRDSQPSPLEETPAASLPQAQTASRGQHPMGITAPVASSTVTHHRVIQPSRQLPTTITTQQIVQNPAGLIPGSTSQTGQQFVVKTASGAQIQFPPAQIQDQTGSSPAPAQQFSVPSPLVSRSLTPSQSPAPSISPHVSRSVTPNQSVLTQSVIGTTGRPPSHHSTSPSPNILQLANSVQSQSQVHLTNAVPIQGILQNPSQNTSIIPGQAVIPGQTPNIVHTQNAVIQNPNVVNVNVAHVLCNNSQQVGQQGQIQGGIQGLPVTVPNQTIQGNPVNIHGTIIQTPQGKSILIPNQQLAGQQINLGNISNIGNLSNFQHVAVQPQASLGQHIVQGGGTVVQSAQGNMALGNVIRFTTQPGQDKSGNVAPPNISLVNLGGTQGQQILIQRAPAPTAGQHQNIILRTISPNIIQIQQGNQSVGAGQPGNLSGTHLHTASQISQQILNHAANQSVQFQPVLAGGQTQQVKLVNQHGSQQTSQAGAVTLNLAGQNVNIQQISGLGSGAVPGIQFQNGGQFIVQQANQNVNSQPVVKTSNINQGNIVTKAMISSGISHQANTHFNKQTVSANQIEPNNTSVTSGQMEMAMAKQNSRTNQSVKNQKQSKSVDSQMQGTPQQLAHNLQNVPIPISQLIATASSAAGIRPTGISTVQSSPTPVTTTVSQAMVQIPTQLTVASSIMGTQVVSSVPTVASTGVIQSTSTAGTRLKIQPQSQILKSGPPNVSISPRLQPVQPNPNERANVQQIQQSFDVRNMTPEQKQQLHQLSMLQNKLMVSSRQSSVKSAQTSQQFTSNTVVQKSIEQGDRNISTGQSSVVIGQPMVGQPQIAQPQVAITTSQQQPQQQVQNKPLNPIVTNQTSVSHPSVVVQSQQSGHGLVRFSLAQPVTSAQVVTTVAQNISSQYLPKIIQQSPVKGGKSTSCSQPQLIQIQPNQQVTARTSMSSGTVIQGVPPGKLPISATPAVPTQIKIANQVLTLNLTPQQKEKLQTHLSKMTIEQQEMFLKQQQNVLLKLQQQHQIQQQIQVQLHQPSPQIKPQLLVASPAGKIPITVQQIDKGINQIKVGTDTNQTGTPSRGVKRPAVVELPKISLIHQQLNKDQSHAVSPDVKSPFKNNREACRRLLRYHVFQSPGPSADVFDKADELFEQVSQELLRKSQVMMEKYRQLLLEESMRVKPSAEMVMIQRMLNQDLTCLVKEEKAVVAKNPDAFEPMPLKYLKKDKCKDVEGEASTAESSAADESIIKSEPNIESDMSSDTIIDTKSDLLSSIPPTRLSVKSSPSYTPGSVKLVIRNDGRGFTSSLATKSESLKDESPEVEQKLLNSHPAAVSVKTEPLDHSDFCEIQTEQYLHKPGQLDIVKNEFDSSVEDMEDSMHRSRGPEVSCVSELPSFQPSGETLIEEQSGSGIFEPGGGTGMTQPLYSDVSITDMSGEYGGTISPIDQSSPREKVTAALGSEIPHNYDPVGLDFSADLPDSLCPEPGTSQPNQTSYNGISCNEGFTNALINSDVVHTDQISASPVGINLFDDNSAAAFSGTQQPSAAVSNPSEIQSAVDSIMDFEDVSSDGGNVADMSTISSGKEDISVSAECDKSLSDQRKVSYSPSMDSDFSQIELSEQNIHTESELDASFESDTNDQQNHMMNDQVQSAIDSILSINQDDAGSGYFLHQSNSVTSFHDNQISEITDVSQESSDCVGEGEEEEEAEVSRKGDNGNDEGDGDVSEDISMEDDLDAAVQSILM